MSEPVALGVGDHAPAFRLSDQNGTPVSSQQILRQKNMLVVFYPFAFSGVCTGELRSIRDDLGAFVSDAVQVVAISCDPIFSLRAWADVEGYFFPLLSDFWPHGGVARAYGVLDEAGGFAHRGTFLVDATGVIRWSLVNPPAQERDFSGYRAALQSLQ